MVIEPHAWNRQQQCEMEVNNGTRRWGTVGLHSRMHSPMEHSAHGLHRTPTRDAPSLQDATAVELPAGGLQEPQGIGGLLHKVAPAPDPLVAGHAARSELP